MKAFKVNPIKKADFENNAIPTRSANTAPIPDQKGPNKIPMMTCGINVTLILIKGVSIDISRDKVTIKAINSPMIAIIRASNRFFFIFSISFKSCYTIICSECENKTANKSPCPSSRWQHPILLALNALFPTLILFWETIPSQNIT